MINQTREIGAEVAKLIGSATSQHPESENRNPLTNSVALNRPSPRFVARSIEGNEGDCTKASR